MSGTQSAEATGDHIALCPSSSINHSPPDLRTSQPSPSSLSSRHVVHARPRAPLRARTGPAHHLDPERHQGALASRVYFRQHSDPIAHSNWCVQVSIALEELKLVGAIPGYSFVPIAFSSNDQKADWFLAVNPNGRIPALIDNRKDKGPINVWEVSPSLALVGVMRGAWLTGRALPHIRLARSLRASCSTSRACTTRSATSTSRPTRTRSRTCLTGSSSCPSRSPYPPTWRRRHRVRAC